MTVTDDMMNRVVELSSMTDEDYFNNLYRLAPQLENRRGRPAANLSNPLHVYNIELDFKDADESLWLDNILSGTIACLEEDWDATTHRGSRISTVKLMRLYERLPSFNTMDVMSVLRLSRRQAERYMQAIKASNPFISARLMHQCGAIT